MTVTGTLEQIRNKVRLITGRPSPTQLSDADLDNYINDFYQYDFPAHLKTWNLQTILSPLFGPDDALIPDTAIYVFDWNQYTNIGPTFYVGGYEIPFYQNTQAFFNFFNTKAVVQQLSTGTGIAGPYAGIVTNTPILGQGIFLSTIDNAGNSLHTSADAAGQFEGTGVLAPVPAGGTINYDTGVVAGLTWTGVIAVGEPIWAQSLTYVSGRPQAVLFYDGALLFYPVPDIAYEVACTVNIVPDELGPGDQPVVRDWWNAIALGAARKIFIDNLDIESLTKLQPVFDEQMRLVERRTLKQLSTQRASTIYDAALCSSSTNTSGYPAL